MTSKKQDSGRTMIEMIAVLILVAIITLGGIFGFSWLVQSYQKNEGLKHANTVIVTLQNSRIIRKSDQGEPISIKSVVSGPKTAEDGKVMVLSDKDPYFMVVTAMGTEEYIADLQIEPGTCAEYMNAFSEYSALFKKDDETLKSDSPTALLKNINGQNRKAATFAPLSEATIQNCEETGRFRAAFNVSGRTDEEDQVYLYSTPDEDTPVEFHRCASDKKEDANGNCCSATVMCGDLCQCPSGTRCSNNSCVECTDDSHCSNTNQTCKDNECVCKEPFTPYNGECVCEPGYAWNGTTCTPCAVGTYKSTYGNDTSCIDCPDGTTTSGERSTSRADCTCGENTTLYNGECQCGPGYAWNGTTCTPCAVGTYKTSIGNNISCTDCPDGTTTKGEGSTSVQECSCDEAAGFKKDSVDGVCKCEPGKYEKDGTCTPCAEGTYKDWLGNDACNDCDEGSFQYQTGKASCIQCREVKAYSTTNGPQKKTMDDCLCMPGYTLKDGTCTPCDVGTYKDLPGNGNGTCTLCPAGTYQDEEGQTSCKDCGGGQTTARTGSTASTQCVCPSGQNWNGSTCVACPANAVWSNNQCQCNAGYTGDGTTCQPCDQGTYKAGIGNGACTACPTGTYQDKTGQTQCTACGSNKPYTASTGSTAKTQCKRKCGGFNFHHEENCRPRCEQETGNACRVEKERHKTKDVCNEIGQWPHAVWFCDQTTALCD